MPHMDAQEQVALDLEMQQNIRYQKAGKKDDFWDVDEIVIFNQIKKLRKYSKTYQPENYPDNR